MAENPVQYLVHDALRPRLEAWLAAQGFRVDLLPLDDDSLPTYLVAPSDELMAVVWEPPTGPGDDPAIRTY